jgi:predicted ATPase/DNA-binding CsgD family transcriptional regulator
MLPHPTPNRLVLALDAPWSATYCAATLLSTQQGSRPAHNLPAQPTALIGRAAILADSRARLLRADLRLLTLTGPGGTGKTRLAIELAATLAPHFADGAWFVDLSSLADDRLVAAAIARVLDLDTGSDRPVLELLAHRLRDDHRLLVLDNFEQVLGAATDVAALLSECPGLKVLATSRAPLDLTWEHVFYVPPLALPVAGQRTPDALAECPSVALFLERARAARGEFTLSERNAADVAEICVRLDGLPLAIELAAARSRLLPPPTLLSRLQHRLDLLRTGHKDAPARHHTMAGAIEWSYELLPEDERVMFRRLGVFAGGCSLEAAEAIAPDLDVLEGLGSLVDKSLLRLDEVGGEPRYRLLETIREYAVLRLKQAQEWDITACRHAGYLLRLVELAEPELRGARQAGWLDRFEREHDNLRAALAWSITNDLDTALRLAAGLWRFWFTRGYMLEGRRWVESALEASATVEVSARSRARALTAAGEMAWGCGDVDRAAIHHSASLVLRRELGDLEGVSQALHNLGNLAIERDDRQQAHALHEEALAIRRQLGNPRDLSLSLNNLGRLLMSDGEMDAAEPLLVESLALAREVGGDLTIAGPLRQLGELALHRGDVDLAAERFAECLRLAAHVGAPMTMARGIETGAMVAHLRGEMEVAAELLAAGQALRDAIRSPRVPTERAACEPALVGALRALGPERFRGASELGRALSPEVAVEKALQALEHKTVAVPVPAFAAHPASPGGLSQREVEVAALIAQGMTNREIAERLIIAERTTHAHVRNILDKLGFSSRTQVATWALQHGL